MSLQLEVRMLIALREAEQHMDAGVAVGWALSQSSKAHAVDPAALALLWHDKTLGCLKAREALRSPNGYDTAKATDDGAG